MFLYIFLSVLVDAFYIVYPPLFIEVGAQIILVLLEIFIFFIYSFYLSPS